MTLPSGLKNAINLMAGEALVSHARKRLHEITPIGDRLTHIRGSALKTADVTRKLIRGLPNFRFGAKLSFVHLRARRKQGRKTGAMANQGLGIILNQRRKRRTIADHRFQRPKVPRHCPHLISTEIGDTRFLRGKLQRLLVINELAPWAWRNGMCASVSMHPQGDHGCGNDDVFESLRHVRLPQHLQNRRRCARSQYVKINATKLHYNIHMTFLSHIFKRFRTTPFLGWSAGMRIAAVVPLLALLGMAIWWASLEAAPI